MYEQDFLVHVRKIFAGKNPPFLFIGSGFSRRYIGLDTFDGLLRSTCIDGMEEYEYYLSSSSGDLPKTAYLISQDFQEKVWKNKNFVEFINKYKKNFIKNTDAFKYYVASILKNKHLIANDKGYLHCDEIEKLKKASIDAIITTNYDRLLEEIFTHFRTFIGQDELIQNNLQFVGEIYKIHGCVTKPQSIIITSKDYSQFEEKNKYIVSKLITSFIERPILFVGYSISDAHIQNILKDVAFCCAGNLDRIKDNLIFLKRSDSNDKNIYQSFLDIGTSTIPYWCIETNDFGEIYEQITSRRKIPINLLRIFKEQLYELVLQNEPSSRILLINEEKLDEYSDVEFVVGIGVTKLSLTGYEQIKPQDIFSDILHEKTTYDVDYLLKKTIPNLLKKSDFIPIYKYLNILNIHSIEELKENNLYDVLKKAIEIPLEKYATNLETYIRKFNNIPNKTIPGVIQYLSNENRNDYVMRIIPMVDPCIAKNDICILKDYLIFQYENYEKMKGNSRTEFAKNICFYDRVKYGWF